MADTCANLSELRPNFSDLSGSWETGREGFQTFKP